MMALLSPRLPVEGFVRGSHDTHVCTTVVPLANVTVHGATAPTVDTRHDPVCCGAAGTALFFGSIVTKMKFLFLTTAVCLVSCMQHCACFMQQQLLVREVHDTRYTIHDTVSSKCQVAPSVPTCWRRQESFVDVGLCACVSVYFFALSYVRQSPPLKK